MSRNLIERHHSSTRVQRERVIEKRGQADLESGLIFGNQDARANTWVGGPGTLRDGFLAICLIGMSLPSGEKGKVIIKAAGGMPGNRNRTWDSHCCRVRAYVSGPLYALAGIYSSSPQPQILWHSDQGTLLDCDSIPMLYLSRPANRREVQK